MADPLSIASGAAGILSFGIQVTQSLVDFYNSYRNQDTEIGRTLENLQSVFNILQFLDAAIRNPQSRPEEQELSQEIGKAIEKSEEIIGELQDEYAKFQKVPDSGFGNRMRTASRRATYPFRTSTLQKLQEDVDEIRENLEFALSVLQQKNSITTHEEIYELRLLVERIDINQTSSKIRDWLKAPDATINHNSARMKCHTKTGLWLLKGDTFKNWLKKSNSFIWLNGFAGSGKSILCSTAIQHTLRKKQYEQRVGIAFFYFDFRDQNKQDCIGMLRALLLQLSGQLGECAQDLGQLYKAYEPGTPPTDALIVYLQRMIKRFHHVYILLDALDESPRYNKRDEVLEAIETIRMWRLPGLHLLVTSRNEIDIRRSLDPASDHDIPMKNTEIDQDIASFVHYQLNNNPVFSKWKAEYDEIISTLTQRAQGVFRYVQLQLNALKRALNRNHLYRYLHSLPRNLDETYERILDSIEKDYVDDIRRLLGMLCFSKESLTVNELIHAHAVDLNEPPHLDPGRLLDIDGLQEICAGLIEIMIVHDHEDREVQMVRIAHFSVQEYIQSDRIKQRKTAIFALNVDDVEVEAAQVCLVYLLNPALSNVNLENIGPSPFPLARYAAKNWYRHYKAAHNRENETEKLVAQLFKDQSGLFNTWVDLHDFDPTWIEKGNRLRFGKEIVSPLYCASYLGLANVLRELILIGLDVNTPGGIYHSALQAASYRGHETIVRMLLEEGADVNNRGSICRGALQLASNESHEIEADTLQEHDAGVDIYHTAVQLASAGGHEAIVDVLLAHGADVNIHGKKCKTAIQGASAGGYEAIVKTLLAHNADVNVQEQRRQTALQAASSKGHTEIVRMLLAHGADASAHQRTCETALQAASARGYEEIVQILLDHGTDVNIYDELYGTALQATSASGHEATVQILLAHGADANTCNEFYGRTPQQNLSVKYQETTLQLLLEHDEDPNVHGEFDNENILQNASDKDRTAIAILVETDDIFLSSHYGKYANALQAASSRGHEAIVKMLLVHGADVNARHKELGTALQSAATEGHESIVEILLAHGAIDDRHPEPAQEQREKEGYQED